jgi:ketosteroid isomerase-like protein
MTTMPNRKLDKPPVLCAAILTMAMLVHPLGAQVRIQPPSLDSTAVVSTVDRFQQALARADSVAALALLADSALILESGELETRGAYRSHHLAADVEFARAVTSDRHLERVVVAGDAAWIVSTSQTRGKFRGRDVDSISAELMVLTRTPAGWRIAAIHWSSRRASGG